MKLNPASQHLRRHIAAALLVALNIQCNAAASLVEAESGELGPEAPCFVMPDAAATCADSNAVHTAVASCVLAAAGGDARAAYRLAQVYKGRYGVAPDMSLVARYNKRAADLGYVAANADYAYQMNFGENEKKDLVLVEHYMQRAAARGSAAGQLWMARRILQTRTVLPQDKVQAWCWYELAVRSVDASNAYVAANISSLERHRPDELNWRRDAIIDVKNIPRIRDDLGETMSLKQLEQAERCAETWRPVSR